VVHDCSELVGNLRKGKGHTERVEFNISLMIVKYISPLVTKEVSKTIYKSLVT